MVHETELNSILVAESYLMALCESDRKMQILDVVKNIDVTKLSSAKSIADIFQSLGRFQLESVADDLLLDLRARGMIMILFSYLSIIAYGIRGGALAYLMSFTTNGTTCDLQNRRMCRLSNRQFSWQLTKCFR